MHELLVSVAAPAPVRAMLTLNSCSSQDPPVDGPSPIVEDMNQSTAAPMDLDIVAVTDRESHLSVASTARPQTSQDYCVAVQRSDFCL